MKKKLYNFPFKSNFFKEQDPFHLVIIFFIIFFGTAIFFSVPTFYDYEKYNQKIVKTINQEFKINIYNLKDISFRFIPSPHLLIKSADLKIKNDEEDILSELKNIKVFLSITDLYKDKYKIKKVVVRKANFYLNNLSLKNFTHNLKKNIINNFIIKKSTLFFKNKNDEIILLSSIKDFNYQIDYINNKKILSIIGNIFDSDYEFNYLIDYKSPNIQNINLKLKEPNLQIENKLEDDLTQNTEKQIGTLILNFLSNKNIINYKIIKNKIEFKNKNFKNTNFDINGYINFHPFHFDLSLDLKKNNLKEIENLLYFIYKNQNMKLENLSGNLTLKLNNIENKVLKKALLELKFNNSKLSTTKKIFYLSNFAILEVSDYEYLANNDEILQMNAKLIITNKEKFNRFLFNYNKDRIVSENLFFTYQFNSSTKNSFISQISNSGFLNRNQFYKFKNLQQLKNLLKDDKVFILE